jgi:glutamate dehydrogenase (NADP+)
MREVHDVCADTAERYDAPDNYVVGANMAGFIRVAEAMLALGLT